MDRRSEHWFKRRQIRTRASVLHYIGTKGLAQPANYIDLRSARFAAEGEWGLSLYKARNHQPCVLCRYIDVLIYISKKLIAKTLCLTKAG